MQSNLAAFCLGILGLAWPYATPDAAAAALCGIGFCLCVLLLCLRARYRLRLKVRLRVPLRGRGVRARGVRGRGYAGLLLALLAGYGYGTFSVMVALDKRLPACSDEQFRSLTIRLTEEPVALGAPVLSDGTGSRSRFAARIEADMTTDCPGIADRMLRLTWYDPPQLHVGDVWQVTAKVRPPWSYQNPGGFDYERWLLAKHLHGTGYVREGSLVTRAFAPTEIRPVKQQIRQWLVARESPHAGVTFALLTGDGSLILPSVWENFRATGTVHLVVVSGLHVGIVAGAAFALGQLFARAVPGILLWAGARRFATLFAVLVAGGYVAFSGFGLPAVRAWIMTSIMLIAIASGRRFSVAFMFTIALTGILIWDPLAVHQQGFWLSFSAVGGLIWYFSPQVAKVGRVRQLLLMQTVLLVVMVPLLAGLNGVVPLISPLANLLVVPMVTLLVLPLSFLTGVAVVFAPSFADVVFTVVEFFLQIVEVIIQFFSQMPLVYTGEFSTVEMLVLGLTAAVLLAAPSMRRLLGVLPLWLSWSASVDAGVPFGEFRVTALDVGQGSSIVIDTSAHRLLFDAAPRYPGGFDLGEAAVVPAIVATGSSVLDVAVLSHDDIDHTGGFAAIHRTLQPLSVWAAESIALPEFVQARVCRVGVHWQWDGVDFRFLHPTAGPVRNDNEGSCVLLVDNGHHRLLLPGDIGRVTERQILRGRALNVDVLLAPHHGSNASSSNAWVLTLQPAVVLISAPRRSQYGHPHPAVVDRYRKQGARVFVTGLDGALQWRSWTSGQVLRWRSAKGAYWTNQNPDNSQDAMSR